ncbi:sphingosine kinase (diacylglycerol kinase catalytic domain-containing protein) [Phlyctema vagabunda]|uniref:Sphingosine kinase (Diacylglycerol kinase catalytic domain-containing protein) n=1 Tax=Phlyctema vagabunda TaxID=108571 RepID=A0ABR4PN56_9HELO
MRAHEDGFRDQINPQLLFSAGFPMADDTVVTEPGKAQPEAASVVESTLFVNKNVSLTLSPQSLIILANDSAKKSDKKSAKAAGASRRSVTLDTAAYSEPVGGSNARAIPLQNILWAELTENEFIIHYAKEVSKPIVQASMLKYQVEERDRAESWIGKLLERAYGKSQLRKRVKVLVNPKSGKGAAEKIYTRDVEPIFDAARCEIDFTITKHQGEAIDIAEAIDVDAFDVIVCCSGDGLPHEVFNGLAKRKDATKALSKIAVVQIPCGSGNAMHCNSNGNINSPSIAALSTVKGIRTPLDLISITQGNTRLISFLSQALGIVAEFDLATEHLRWMGGTARFTYGFLVRALQKKVYPCDLAVKVIKGDKEEIKDIFREEVNRKNVEAESGRDLQNTVEGLPPLRYGTINDELPGDWEVVSDDKMSSFYCGNMSWMATDVNYFAAALPNDGCMDLVTIGGDIGRVSALALLPAVESGKFYGLPHVSYRKIAGYRIIPRNQEDGYISIDGERVPFAPFQAEIHKGLGTILTKTGHVFESPGPQ